MNKQSYLAVVFITGIALSLHGTPVLADGLSAEEALPTTIDAPPPPLLQAEGLIPPPQEENVVEQEIAPPPETDLWPIISKGMILLKSEPDGEIISSEDPKELLGLRDTVYLHAEHELFLPGEELIIYRTSRPVFHPITSNFLGDLVQVLGAVRVKTVGKDVSTAEIILSRNTISKLDKVASIDRFILPPAEQSLIPEEGLEAMIIESTENRVSLAQHDIVYIDQGRDEGISPGDQFVVIHGGEREGAFSGSDTPEDNIRLPYREIGTMIVLATQEHTATAKITNSLESISRGDTVLYLHE